MAKKMEKADFKLQRQSLVTYLKSTFAIQSRETESAFLFVPREEFFPAHLRSHAYEDSAFSIGPMQSVSQPSTIAPMLELLKVRGGMKVLEVGSGSGYVLALLSRIAGPEGKVFGIELSKDLCGSSRLALKRAKCRATVVRGDGTRGLTKKAPFDRILVSEACPYLPKALFDQLKDNGIAVAPVGDRQTQQLESIQKRGGKIFRRETARGFYVFVPLLGAFLKENL